MFFKFPNSRTIQGDAKKCPVCKFPISRTAFKNCKKMQNFRVFKPANRLTTKNTIHQLVYRLTSLHPDTSCEFTKNMKKCIKKHKKTWRIMNCCDLPARVYQLWGWAKHEKNMKIHEENMKMTKFLPVVNSPKTWKNALKNIKKHEELWIVVTSLRGSTNCGVGQNMKKHENTWKKHENDKKCQNVYHPWIHHKHETMHKKT